jgi:hypothetical protein
MTREIRNRAASIHQRLKDAAKRDGTTFNDLLQHYALERFLVRLATSEHRAKFILKGALMMRVWDISALRPTRDIDLLGRTSNREDHIAKIIQDICVTSVDPDGIEFDPNSVHVIPIAKDADYSGVRAEFYGNLAKARLPMQVDVGFSDIVTPKPIHIEYPSVLGLPRARLLAYTPETSIAEKFHVMLDRGRLNSRMKDFFDVWALSRALAFDGNVLATAVVATCRNRATEVTTETAVFDPEFYRESSRKMQWRAFQRRLESRITPDSLEEIGACVVEFLLPLASAIADGRTFDRSWHSGGPWN